MTETRCGLAISGRQVAPDRPIALDDWVCRLPTEHDGLHCTPDNTLWSAPPDRPQEPPQ